MNRSTVLTFAAALAGACALPAQTTNPLIEPQKATYNRVKGYLLQAADKMKDDDYGFKPTPELQSFAQRVAHVAASGMGTCSGLTGERKTSDANTKTAKADLVAALKASFDACDAAWESMNDKTAMDMVAGRGGQQSKLAVLIGNTIHIDEVYGTMTVYMRLKGAVPPSSEGAGAPRGGRSYAQLPRRSITGSVDAASFTEFGSRYSGGDEIWFSSCRQVRQTHPQPF